jgi:hypothetical protein
MLAIPWCGVSRKYWVDSELGHKQTVQVEASANTLKWNRTPHKNGLTGL